MNHCEPPSSNLAQLTNQGINMPIKNGDNLNILPTCHNNNKSPSLPRQPNKPLADLFYLGLSKLYFIGETLIQDLDVGPSLVEHKLCVCGGGRLLFPDNSKLRDNTHGARRGCLETISATFILQPYAVLVKILFYLKFKNIYFLQRYKMLSKYIFFQTKRQE